MEGTNGYMEIRAENEELNSLKNSSSGQFPGLKQPNSWFLVFLFISLLLVGSPCTTLLTRFYYDNGGKSVWLATILQSAAFPIWIPLLFLRRSKSPSKIIDDPPRNAPLLTYLFLGTLLAAVNLMYSYGLMYLPVSTFSLICASQLAFNAIFSFFLNSQKFTALIFNSIFLLTASASLLAVHPDSNDTAKEKHRYIVGIVITVFASAFNSLSFSLSELSFGKVLKKEPFDAALDLQFYQSFVSTCITVVGLFLSGEGGTLPDEMQSFLKGRVSYVMTLVWIAVAFQIAFLGLFGLIFEVSSLFSNMVATIALPIVPVLGVVIFHDKVDGVKIIALLLAIGGFLNYIYQNYLDDVNSRDSSVSCEDHSDV